MDFGVIDSYKKSEGRYLTYKEYLIYFSCNECNNSWAIDEAEITLSEVDELSHTDDLVADSIQCCPLCGSSSIFRNK